MIQGLEDAQAVKQLTPDQEKVSLNELKQESATIDKKAMSMISKINDIFDRIEDGEFSKLDSEQNRILSKINNEVLVVYVEKISEYEQKIKNSSDIAEITNIIKAQKKVIQQIREEANVVANIVGIEIHKILNVSVKNDVKETNPEDAKSVDTENVDTKGVEETKKTDKEQLSEHEREIIKYVVEGVKNSFQHVNKDSDVDVVKFWKAVAEYDIEEEGGVTGPALARIMNVIMKEVADGDTSFNEWADVVAFVEDAKSVYTKNDVKKTNPEDAESIDIENIDTKGVEETKKTDKEQLSEHERKAMEDAMVGIKNSFKHVNKNVDAEIVRFWKSVAEEDIEEDGGVIGPSLPRVMNVIMKEVSTEETAFNKWDDVVAFVEDGKTTEEVEDVGEIKKTKLEQADEVLTFFDEVGDVDNVNTDKSEQEISWYEVQKLAKKHEKGSPVIGKELRNIKAEMSQRDALINKLKKGAKKTNAVKDLKEFKARSVQRLYQIIQEEIVIFEQQETHKKDAGEQAVEGALENQKEINEFYDEIIIDAKNNHSKNSPQIKTVVFGIEKQIKDKKNEIGKAKSKKEKQIKIAEVSSLKLELAQKLQNIIKEKIEIEEQKNAKIQKNKQESKKKRGKKIQSNEQNNDIKQFEVNEQEINDEIDILFDSGEMEKYIGTGKSKKVQKNRDRIEKYKKEIFDNIVKQEQASGQVIDRHLAVLDYVRKQRAPKVISILEKQLESIKLQTVVNNKNIDKQNEYSEAQQKRENALKNKYGIDAGYTKYVEGQQFDGFILQDYVISDLPEDDYIIIDHNGEKKSVSVNEFELSWIGKGYKKDKVKKRSVEQALGNEVVDIVVRQAREFRDMIDKDANWNDLSQKQKNEELIKITKDFINDSVHMLDASYAESMKTREITQIYKKVVA